MERAHGVEETEEWPGCPQRSSFGVTEGCFGHPPPPSLEKVGHPSGVFWGIRGCFGRPEHAPGLAKTNSWVWKRPGTTCAWGTVESAVSESEWWAFSPNQAVAVHEKGKMITFSSDKPQFHSC